MVDPPRFPRKRRHFPEAFRTLPSLWPGRDRTKLSREAQTCVFRSATAKAWARARAGATSSSEISFLSRCLLVEHHHLPTSPPGLAAKGRCSRRCSRRAAQRARSQRASSAADSKHRSLWKKSRRSARIPVEMKLRQPCHHFPSSPALTAFRSYGNSATRLPGRMAATCGWCAPGGCR